MWEFSLNFKTENFELAKYIHNTLITFVEAMDGVVTSNEENGTISVLIAVKEENKQKVKLVIESAVAEIICSKFKSDYLNRSLVLPALDNTSVYAFKKALLNFDKETDKYIIKKNLNLENNLYLESFYHFKLKALQDKWEELVCLSNENKEYLVSRESFIDLLKFLVDNLDIYEEEINVIKEEDGYRIFAEGEECDNGLISEDSVVSSIIDLSPQKINLYCSETSNAVKLLERIFEERITINRKSIQNIQKFKLN